MARGCDAAAPCSLLDLGSAQGHGKPQDSPPFSPQRGTKVAPKAARRWLQHSKEEKEKLERFLAQNLRFMFSKAL